MAELLAAAPRAGESLEVRVVPGRTLLQLKSLSLVRESTPGVQLEGQALGSAVGSVAAGMTRILCTAPGEWLAVVPEANAARLQGELAPQLARESLALLDMSAALVTLKVTGSNLLRVFSQSCGLDFEPRRFPADTCARTRFARIAVLIDCRSAGQEYDLYVSRSYSAYLEGWLHWVQKSRSPAEP
jgi:heterotetrameric sarcosine oxidase gamma subunit